MNPVHFLFPSADLGPMAAGNGESCGCSDSQEKADYDYLEDEPTVKSEIVETGEPYKEIEILINDNRMVLRIQRLPVGQKEEWDPPCDCLPSPEKPETKPDKVVTALPPPSPPQPSDALLKKTDNQRLIDLVENPNMFLLKIRKRSETSDRKRENIDLEFRTPRPWLSKPIEKKRKTFREEYQEQQAAVVGEADSVASMPKKSKKGKK